MISTEREPEQAFAAPWHAEVFALAVHLNERGIFAGQNGLGALAKIWLVREVMWLAVMAGRDLMAAKIII